jgi:very-short-patch-repair endonuclease
MLLVIIMIEYILFFLLFSFPMYLGLKRINDNKHAEPVTTDYEYSKCQSPIERMLYRALRNNGYIVRTQVPCGKYRIDLALVRSKLAIECDGKASHSSPAQKAHDRRKNAYLRKHGWKVLRFSGSRIYRDISGVLRRIEKEL